MGSSTLASTASTTTVRVPLIAGNWKMYKNSGEGAAFLDALARRLGGVKDREVVVAPPFTGLYEAVKAAAGTDLIVSAQDMHWEVEGAYTGEISPSMLADLGVQGVIIGHSERRQYFGETDDWVSRKVRAALNAGLRPIACVGETASEREVGLTEEILHVEVGAAVSAVRPQDVRSFALAYEPTWAIGTGHTATPEIAQQATAFCRAQMAAVLGQEAAAKIRILYGGSVRPDNIDDLMVQPDIDGVLVGGASLDVEAFSRIVEFRAS
jgi:triosephosphate isomerase (TIM)